ncbi:type I-E CRISPR-associated protein Cas7/Cse4/CasC [Salinibacter altiplanensis]|uniref:type I-E CRISPR-associated protein Cas7/Cse4/CasC n=1 Tax=Salinibacter altiplanensis TaxID=1803181 RepID=UPI000C9FCD5C|nr:type I-E CRISPR-associated protein Cas7/Cse4/CasC [Salinibacter altiplanensis]
MFIQLHALTSYPSTLLNRDDAGFAKQLPFGGATRTRVSSQCLKYHWRNFDGEHALYDMDVPRSLRSRETFYRRIVEPLVEDGHLEPLVACTALALQERLLSDDRVNLSPLKGLLNEEDDPREVLETNQVTIFGAPEMRYLRDLAAKKVEAVTDEFPVVLKGEEPDSSTISDAAKALRDFSKGDLRKNLRGLELASGLDAAMFGRMATSDVLARGDAAVHVAHAFTTHAQESESDYFSAVDELRRDEPEESGELGAGHINTQELTSGLFYSYVVVDVPLLVSNLSGVERDDWQDGNTALATEVMRRFTHLMTTVSPGAKLGSTAPYSYAQCLFAEVGTAQPRTLANAFQKPVRTDDVLANSYEKLGQYVDEIDQMYGVQTDRRLAAMGPTDRLTGRLKVDDTTTVPDLAEWTAHQIEGGQ